MIQIYSFTLSLTSYQILLLFIWFSKLFSHCVQCTLSLHIYAYHVRHTTGLYGVGITEKYDHIQTELRKIFGLYGVVLSGIYDSIQIRYSVGLYGVVLYSVGLYVGGDSLGDPRIECITQQCSLHHTNPLSVFQISILSTNKTRSLGWKVTM